MASMPLIWRSCVSGQMLGDLVVDEILASATISISAAQVFHTCPLASERRLCVLTFIRGLDGEMPYFVQSCSRSDPLKPRFLQVRPRWITRRPGRSGSRAWRRRSLLGAINSSLPCSVSRGEFGKYNMEPSREVIAAATNHRRAGVLVQILIRPLPERYRPYPSPKRAGAGREHIHVRGRARVAAMVGQRHAAGSPRYPGEQAPSGPCAAYCHSHSCGSRFPPMGVSPPHLQAISR